MFWTRYVKRVPFVNKEVPLFCQRVLKGLDLSAEPPCMTLCWVPTPTRALNGFFPIRKFERNAALSLWLQVGGQQKSYPLGESLGCLLSLPRASAILYGTQASFAWPRARWSGQIWQICNGHFFCFHGILVPRAAWPSWPSDTEFAGFVSLAWGKLHGLNIWDSSVSTISAL